MRAADFDKAVLWRYRARLLRLIDADTVVCLVDTGFYGRHEVRLRLADIDAAEADEAGGAEATSALAGALRLAGDGPWPLRIVTRQRETVVSEVRSFERSR